MMARLEPKCVKGKTPCRPIQEELNDNPYITSFKGEASHIKTNGHRLFVDGKEMKITQ
jgi:hypothetical protein